MTILKELDRIVGGLGLRWGSVALLGLVFVLLTVNAFLRFFPIVQLGWFDEIVELMVAWIMFLGPAAVAGESSEVTVAFLPDWLKGSKAGHALGIVIDLISLFLHFSVHLLLLEPHDAGGFRHPDPDDAQGGHVHMHARFRRPDDHLQCQEHYREFRSVV